MYGLSKRCTDLCSAFHEEMLMSREEIQSVSLNFDDENIFKKIRVKPPPLLIKTARALTIRRMSDLLSFMLEESPQIQVEYSKMLKGSIVELLNLLINKEEKDK